MDRRYVKLKIPDGAEALASISNNKSAIRVMLKLLELMDDTNGVIARHVDIAVLCDISVPTVKRAIAFLIENKFLCTKRISNGLIYYVNASIATRCSHKREAYESGYELWTCKILMKG